MGIGGIQKKRAGGGEVNLYNYIYTLYNNFLYRVFAFTTVVVFCVVCRLRDAKLVTDIFPTVLRVVTILASKQTSISSSAAFEQLYLSLIHI